MGHDAGYDRLTALDESFLHLERAETPMHVGAVAVLERGPFFDGHGRFRLDEVRALVASRLQLIPRFRKRVMRVPLGQGRPIWVDHEDFDIADHVRLTALPAPGSRRQLLELAERLTVQVLDRDQPLWELWFVEGVDRGEHVGLIHKSHHTLTDGISGVDIATVLLDFCVRADRARARRVGAGARRRIRAAWCSTASWTGSADLPSSPVRPGASPTPRGRARPGGGPRLAPSVPWSTARSSRPVSPSTRRSARGRRFETVRIPLDDAKAIRAGVRRAR